MDMDMAQHTECIRPFKWVVNVTTHLHSPLALLCVFVMCSECPWSVFVNNTLITRNTLQSSVQTCDSCHRAEMWWPAKNGEMKMIKCPSNISLPTRRLFLLIFTGCDPHMCGVLREWRPLVTLWSVSVSVLISRGGRPPLSPVLVTAGAPVSDSWLVTCDYVMTR